MPVKNLPSFNANKKNSFKENIINSNIKDNVHNQSNINNVNIINENNSRINKNINILKEKNKVNNFVKPVTPISKQSNVPQNNHNVNIIILNQNTSQIAGRKNSENDRYEYDRKQQEEAESDTYNDYEISERNKNEVKSKSPIGGLRNYQLKPKIKKQSSNPEQIKNVYNSNKDFVMAQRSSKKNLHKEDQVNIKSARPNKENKINESNYTNSVNNTLNSYRYLNSISKEDNKEATTAFNLNSFLQMLLLFNEYTFVNKPDNEEKIVSEDFSKLLCSLIDNENTKEAILVENNSIQNLCNISYDKDKDINLESNSLVPVPVPNIRLGIKNDIKNKNIQNIEIKYVLLIQTKWREYKFLKLINLKNSDNDKINSELKKTILNSFSNNDTCKKIFSIFNHSMQMFSGVLKNNKSIYNINIRFKFIDE